MKSQIPGPEPKIAFHLFIILNENVYYFAILFIIYWKRIKIK